MIGKKENLTFEFTSPNRFRGLDTWVGGWVELISRIKVVRNGPVGRLLECLFSFYNQKVDLYLIYRMRSISVHALTKYTFSVNILEQQG